MQSRWQMSRVNTDSRPLFFLSQTFVFLRDRPLGETSTGIMIGHLLLTTFWELIW
jgi:hypothetical protein